MNGNTIILPVPHAQASSQGADNRTCDRTALPGASGSSIPKYFEEKTHAFLSCCREVERAMLARRKRIPPEAPRFPVATIRPLGRAGPYLLVDDHGNWRQELRFSDPVAALLFIQTLRVSRSSSSAH